MGNFNVGIFSALSVEYKFFNMCEADAFKFVYNQNTPKDSIFHASMIL